METVEYGRALYYPHIIFESRAWMRTAVLYHDNLARIVPEGVPIKTYASNEEEEQIMRELYILEEKGIISSEYPGSEIHTPVADAFFDFAYSTLMYPQRRAQMIPQLARSSE